MVYPTIALVLLLLFVQGQAQTIPSITRSCPAAGATRTFTLRTTTTVTLRKSGASPSLCNLVQDTDGDTYIPVARSYNGLIWEFAGGGYAAAFGTYWSCEETSCSTDLPAGKYILQSRTIPRFTTRENRARFLEMASFGATPSDLDTFSGSFSQWVSDQRKEEPTYHREFFRSHANPSWRFHKPEFGAALNPCGAQSTWRRNALTLKDLGKELQVKQEGEWWALYIDGHLRSMTQTLEFVSSAFQFVHNGKYKVCSNARELRRGIYEVRVPNSAGNLVCRAVKPESLEVQFPEDFTPPNVVTGSLGRLGNTNVWQKTSEFLPEYVKLTATPASRCNGIPDDYSGLGAPVFWFTNGKEWLIHDPRIKMQENSFDSPLADGGLADVSSARTAKCANVARTIFNEESCVLANGRACLPGSDIEDDEVYGAVVCGSAGEIANDPTLGDSWLDVTAIDGSRNRASGLPLDTVATRFSRQREFSWSQVVMTAKDQLRQRVAWALSQIFSMPKTSISSENRNTEMFLGYYDIFVRNAMGNYRDVLMETTFHPLMAESLSFVSSRSVAAAFQATELKQFPDENFAREIMQLFTIGLVELHNDGTPRLDAQNSTIRTYNSQDIISYAKAWTGFARQPARSNHETSRGTNRFDPMRLISSTRDRFPKANLAGGFIGDKYPLCSELPKQSFLKNGAKYRLLGTLSRPEHVVDALCSQDRTGKCRFPGVVVLDEDLTCKSSRVECGDIDLPRVVKVGSVFYEYVPNFPCVDLAFFEGGTKVSGSRSHQVSVCANPELPVASEACCDPGKITATPNCAFAGERMTMATAAARCRSVGKELCEYNILRRDDTCPHLGSHWTPGKCKIQAKVNENGQVALVHNTGTDVRPYVREDTPSFFRVSWIGGLHPNGGGSCGGGCTTTTDGECLCDVEVTETRRFSSPPGGRNTVLNNVHVAVADPTILGGNQFKSQEINGYKYYSPDGTCCSEETIFEVTDTLTGRTHFLKNIQSTVTVSGSRFRFRNPPQFNSADPHSYSTVDALHETDAVIDSLFYHRNTAPFVAYRLIQRFGQSNPTPRHVVTVANAFRRGSITKGGIEFGSGRYGDLEATVAAAILDRDMTSQVSELDPFSGSLREPILKVIGFMRALEFQSSIPLVELDLMNEKIGQMAHEQPSVFNFFRPEYAPSGIVANATLVAPEASVMSSGRVVGLIEGLWGLVDNGLVSCGGFGYFDCNRQVGTLGLDQFDHSTLRAGINDVSALLTGGRLNSEKRDFIESLAADDAGTSDVLSTAVKMITTTPEFHATNTVDEFPKPKNDVGDANTGRGRYRAVIHLALRGGCDSFNVLVPHPSCSTLHDEYTAVRGAVALPDANILELNGDTTGQQCDRFGLHHELPFLKQMYDDGDLAFLANTGVLTRPVNKVDFQANTETQLFAHNAMQSEIDRLDPFNTLVGTGTLGRIADVLDARGFRTGRTAIESEPLNLAGVSNTPEPIFTLDGNGVNLLNLTDLASTQAREVIDHLNGRGSGSQRGGMFGEVWSTILDQSLNQTEKVFYLLQKNTDTATEFGTQPLDKRVKLISQLIQTRVERGIDREMFFLTYGSFDHHSDVIGPLASRLASVNKAMEDLVSELKAIGVWDDVVIVQTSDFARTLSPNSGGGSDHAWGGNYWMAGGSVKGNRIVGEYPSLSLDSDVCVDNVRGRLFPTTPWDSPFQAIASWMGVRIGVPDEINAVLPNRGNFRSLFRAGDMFNL